MIVVDGRTDYDKLLELLGVPEETHLDLKAKVDMTAAEDKLKLVKDIVAMSNRPPGGYILIGVDDSGTPCMPIGKIPDRKRFDGARLGDLVRKYIEGEIHIRVEIHEHKGNEIVLVFIPKHRDGLPVPMNKDGQCADPAGGDDRVVFRMGELWVREGAANMRIRHAHWPDVLSEYAKQIRDEAGALAQTLLREFVQERNESRQDSAGGRAEIPLLLDMDEPTFAEATAAHIEARNDVQLRRFLRTVKKSIKSTSSLDAFTTALDKWTIFCAQALDLERPDLVESAIQSLHDAYSQLENGPDLNRKRLEVVIRIYALGSLAVRLASWETVHSLALQPVATSPFGNWIYSSWIRHAQVEASRAGLTQNDRNAFLISAARELMVNHPAMRPDISDDEIPPIDELTADDVLLNSLCQFDIAYCFVVEAQGTDRGGAYPSSAALSEDRANPIAQKIVADQDVRCRLFPNSDDTDIARAMSEVYTYTIRESSNNRGGRWWAFPPSVRQFIDSNQPG